MTVDRLTLRGGAEHFEFLRGYDEIDIALDTFPYNGGTTTTEALWQGVPVLTFKGDRWASRTSRSLLLAAALQEWVADSEAAFVTRGVRLGQDADTPAMLAEHWIPAFVGMTPYGRDYNVVPIHRNPL